MVKFNRRDKQLKDFDKILDEMRDFQNGSSDEYEISADAVEYELYSESESSFLEDQESSSISDEFEMTPGETVNIIKGRVSYLEVSEDFPEANSEMDLEITKSQIENLSLVDRKEYKDKKNILNPNRKRKEISKRCENFDD